VISLIFTRYLASFARYSLRNVKDRYIWLALLRLNPPTEGIPWDDLRKIYSECQSIDDQGTKWRRKITENFNRLSRVHERTLQTDDRQMDGR